MPAIPGTLLESELFGYERGAFTGAFGSKPGRVELAHRGTLFLDEISELDPSLQSKLLQLLQDGQFCRIGAQEDKKVEVRVVCATNRTGNRNQNTGTFRQDLFYRINVVNLRCRPCGNAAAISKTSARISWNFQPKIQPAANADFKRSAGGMRNTADQEISRELENLIKRYVILGNEEVLTNDLVTREPEFFNSEISLDGPISLKKMTRQCVRELERKVILKVLQHHHWNRKQAARTLGISYRALLYKIRDAGLPSNRALRLRQAEKNNPGSASGNSNSGAAAD